MTFFGWKKRCRQLEAENARLREGNAQLAARLAEAEAKNRQLVPVASQQKIIQQVELVEKPFVVTEHVAQGYGCQGCQCHHYAAFPPEVLAAGLCGPRLTSLGVAQK